MLKPYTVTTWVPNYHDTSEGMFADYECLISEEQLEMLNTDKPPKFIKTYVDDGDEFWIPVNNINQINQDRFKNGSGNSV